MWYHSKYGTKDNKLVRTISNQKQVKTMTLFVYSLSITLKSLALAISKSDGNIARNVLSLTIAGFLRSVSQSPFVK